MKVPQALRASAASPQPFNPPTQAYLTIPYRLISDLYDTPLAIGLYSLVARLYLVVQDPVPLSTGDVQRFDPGLSRGAIMRALGRLVRGGWLIDSARSGHKTCYTPCWGLVGGAPRPWTMGATALGRPRHIHALRMERRLLDTYMGRLIPHTTRAALVDRYISRPLLGLIDVGTYLLALHGQPASTPLLLRYGLVARGIAQPLPCDEAILAQASQRSLEDQEEYAITAKGFRKLGWTPAQASNRESRQQPLFFVPSAMIGTVIAPLIGQDWRVKRPVERSQNEQTQQELPTSRIPGNQIKISETRSPNPSGKIKNAAGVKGQKSLHLDKKVCTWTKKIRTRKHRSGDRNHDRNLDRRRKGTTVTSTRSSEMQSTIARLQELKVYPAVVRELAALPLTTIDAAIDLASTHADLRNPTAWLVTVLRDALAYGWEYACTKWQPRAGTGATPTVAVIQAGIQKAKASGLFLYDDLLPDAGPLLDAGPPERIDHELTACIQSALREAVAPVVAPVVAQLAFWHERTTLMVCCPAQVQRLVVQQLLPALERMIHRLGLREVVIVAEDPIGAATSLVGYCQGKVTGCSTALTMVS